MASGNQYSIPPFQQPAPPKSNTAKIVLIVVGVIAIPMMLACLGIMVGLLLPAVQAAREAARRMSCTNNEKQIVLAFHNYESVYKSFPPAYTVDADGNRLHSWRTLILPFIEQAALYEQIDLNKPWDDPVNLPFSEVVIPTFACPSSPNTGTNLTNYVVVVDDSAIFTGDKPTGIAQIVDGTANTLLIVEVTSDEAVPWMSTDDIDLDTYVNLSRRSNHRGGSNVGFADGSVQFISDEVPPEQRAAMVTRNGNESVPSMYQP